MTFGERLKMFRELAGLSQGELARKAGIHRATITAVENGRQANVNVFTARSLARALEISIDMLVGDSESELEPAVA
ncbi:helix-turn-helix domain-containing protein [Candidatus Entotheonella palauensis]|uniref:helix-turn-helix domain-containing protein n=1 Tax=Candidatus Entotheonella palauensis TaxID=93172 RepID=UPI000B7F0280|nr:helix-turn-helix transcriptional regulator [Candidatus Entotheonella palauensis]